MSDRELDVAIRITHGDFSADVRFRAPSGITVLEGPSGAGKSSSLAVIAGLQRPTEGHVCFGDRAWVDTSRGTFVRPQARRIGFVFQSLALFPHMSAAENVAYGIEGGSKRERIERAHALLEQFRVGHLARRKPGTLSGGEAQRVALARALGPNPHALLLDEPFSALDESLRLALGEELVGIAETYEIPIVHVTHQRGEAERLGARRVVYCATAGARTYEARADSHTLDGDKA